MDEEKDTVPLVSQKPAIRISHELKTKLDSLKVVPVETYESVINRLIQYTKEDPEYGERNKGKL